MDIVVEKVMEIKNVDVENGKMKVERLKSKEIVKSRMKRGRKEWISKNRIDVGIKRKVEERSWNRKEKIKMVGKNEDRVVVVRKERLVEVVVGIDVIKSMEKRIDIGSFEIKVEKIKDIIENKGERKKKVGLKNMEKIN